MKRDDTPKIFDVSRPSRSNPDNTSRPLIVGHRPQMVDPMVNRPDKPSKTDDSPTTQIVSSSGTTHHSMLTAHGDDTAAASIPEHHQAKVISVSEDIKNNLAVAEQTPAQPQPETPPSLPSPEPPASEPAPSANQEEPSPAPTPASELNTPEPLPAAPASPTSEPITHPDTAPTPGHQQAVSAEVHHQSLPMGHAPITSTRRLKHMLLWLFVVIFLAFFLGYIAIDSGFISTNIKLPFHIFGGQA